MVLSAVLLVLAESPLSLTFTTGSGTYYMTQIWKYIHIGIKLSTEDLFQKRTPQICPNSACLMVYFQNKIQWQSHEVVVLCNEWDIWQWHHHWDSKAGPTDKPAATLPYFLANVINECRVHYIVSPHLGPRWVEYDLRICSPCARSQTHKSKPITNIITDTRATGIWCRAAV